MEREEWKPIMGYEGIFEISNFGRVKTLSRDVYNPKKRTITERILKQQKHSDGYLRTTLSHNRVRKSRCIHSLVAEHFIPNPNNLLEVNHIDGNKSNPHVNNLEWTTRRDNMLHAYAMGLQVKRKGKLNHFYGRKHSKEMKEKLSEFNKTHSPLSMKVINSETGMIYSSIRQAAKAEGFKHGTLQCYLTGKIKNKTKLILYDEVGDSPVID